ncbi:MAG: RecX family transcriptional regulator [Sphingobacteriaceae bacterium]|nr:RecX family transcriptional regulator [Sphingobacteriaceae bacterium]
MRRRLVVSAEEALEKMKSWCAYQERSHFDCRKKIFEFGLQKHEIENIISALIEENYLNEERFACALARGKMRIKSWGKIKIKQSLIKHQVSDKIIQKALNSLNEDEYINHLDKIIHKKADQLSEENNIYQSILRHLMTKGFENDLSIARLNVILKNSSNFEA